MNTGAFQHGTHGTTSNNTRTRSSRLHQHKTTTKTALHFVGNRTFQQRNLKQILFGVFYTFGNRIGHFVGLTQAIPNHTVAVANNYDGRKTEATTTFYYFGNPVDGYYALFQVSLVYF